MPLKTLEEVLVDSLCMGPLDEAVERARKNVHEFVGQRMLEIQNVILENQTKLSESQLNIIEILVAMNKTQTKIREFLIVLLAIYGIFAVLLIHFILRSHS